MPLMTPASVPALLQAIGPCYGTIRRHTACQEHRSRGPATVEGRHTEQFP